MTPTSLLAASCLHLLTALSAWLTKAEEQLPDDEAEALLSARLAPDMFPLSTQIRFACVQAQEGVYRLKGEPFPASIQALLTEGRDAGERPGTLADARARIEETVALVRSSAAEPEDADPARPIEHDLPTGMIFDLTAEQYARDWALSQLYFHVVTAYAILRSGGVALGKADYLAHMFAHLRPGTMPQG